LPVYCDVQFARTQCVSHREYAVIFVTRRRMLGFDIWLVRDGPGGRAVLFRNEQAALDHAWRMLTDRRGEILRK
jgi:hypothetical protein